MVEEIKVKKIKDATIRAWGASAAVARELGVTPSYVSMVLNGKRKSLAVMEAAAKLAREKEALRKKRERNIDEAVEAMN